jgi:flagellar L-ring protein precursor FlgH
MMSTGRENKRALLLLPVALLMAACTTVPPTNVHQPMTARPQYRSDALAANLAATGSIYQAGASRTLFEDRRARYVGDTITVTISENNFNAATKSNTNVSKTGSISATAGPFAGSAGQLVPARAERQQQQCRRRQGRRGGQQRVHRDDHGDRHRGLPNGNLLVSGEKQVAIGQGQEYIRLSGIVNPYFVNAANTIPSSQIADARIEYKESGAISEAQVMGWLARFFLTVLPF